MADEQDKESKTEPATAKRRGEARSRGMVARSQDLSAAMAIAGGFAILVAFGAQLGTALMSYLHDSMTSRLPKVMDISTVMAIFYSAAERLVPLLLVITLGLFVIVAAANYWQVGFEINTKAIEWDFSRLNPVKGFGSLFRARALVRALVSILKTIIVVAAAYFPVKAEIPHIALLDRTDLGVIIPFIGALLSKAALGACIALLIVGVADFYYQKWQFEKDLKMSKQEVKEEAKQSEGDPAVKGHIRRKQREAALRRMMEDVPKATVVVTNPTHYAVALRYVVNEDPAPKIVAKGKDLVAQKIKAIAKEHGVPIVENPPLAQGLFRGGEVGEEIPAALYRAVAELLSYVYRLRGKL